MSDVFQYTCNCFFFLLAGVWYDDPKSVDLAKAVVSKSNIKFAGVYLHCGDSYGSRGEDEIKQSGAETHRRLLSFVQK